MGILKVLTEDNARLTQIQTDVNALRAQLSLPPWPSGDIISSCVQVGLNALTNGREVPNTQTFIPLLSIVGLPGANNNVAFPSELDTRVAALAAELSVSTEDLSSLALHAGCLVMRGETENKGFRPSFV